MKFGLSRSALFSASVLALCTASGVSAQEADADVAADEEVDENTIVVTGFRQSLAEARNLKRNSTQFIDAIVSDDIGKLPDNNVAESLQRVSGVQLERGQGEGSNVQIRGLNQNLILFNGRQINGGDGRGSAGPDTLGSSTYGLLTLIPSQLISQLQVEKLSSSSQIEGALGGTINVVTRKPLDASTPDIAATVGAIYKELADDVGYQAFALASTRNADETFGALISASIIKQQVREDGFNTFTGYADLANRVTLNSSDPDTDPNNVVLDPDGNGDGISGIYHIDPRYWRIDDDRTRYGINAMLQWRPSDAAEVTFDSFYTRSESERDRYWLGAFTRTTVNNAVLSPNDVLVSGIIQNRPGQTNVEYQDNFHEIWSNAIRGDFEVTDNIKMSFEGSYTRSEQYLDRTFFRAQSASGRENIAFDLTPDLPEFGFSETLVNDPDDLRLRITFDTDSGSVVDDLALRYDVTLWDSLKLGVRYQSIQLDRDNIGRDIRTNSADLTIATLGNLATTFVLDDYLPGEATSVPRQWLTIGRQTDCQAFLPFYTEAQQAECNRTTLDPENSYELDEEFLSFYAQYSWDTMLGDIPFAGNIGGRYVDRKLTARGSLGVEDPVTREVTFSPIEEVVNDTNFFPSAVARLEVADDIQLRFGAARAIAYPDTGDLNPAIEVDRDFNGQAGSPGLNPFLVNQFDAAAEFYYGADGLLSVGLFYKDVKSFIVSQVADETVPGFDQLIPVRRAVNGEGGSIKGIEFLWNQSFGDWVSALDGFGTSVSYTYIDASTPEVDRFGESLSIPGLSKNNINVIGYYEKGPFGARVALNWRDEYFEELGFANSALFFDSYTDLAASVRYDINDNFSIDLDAVNLLDTRQRQFNSFTEATNRNVEFGRTFKLTLRANF